MGIAVLVRVSDEINPNAPPFIVLTRKMTTLGRHGDVRFDTQTGREISKVHATFYRRSNHEAEKWIIEDNSSMNGTFVNCMKIRRRILCPGDEIVFGGGPDFGWGDFLISSELSSCRYRFIIPDPLVRFADSVDPNACLQAPDTDNLCPICYRPIAGAHTLPCGHSFCRDCIHTWGEASRDHARPTICPMCRAPFLHSQITPEAVIRHGELEVRSVDALLRDLEVSTCKIVRGVSIFKIWTRRHKKWFWRSFDQVKDSPHRKIVFLYLAKATIPHILGATSEELKHALKNFAVMEASDKPEENRRRLILCLDELI
jgi:hypothetical protein